MSSILVCYSWVYFFSSTFWFDILLPMSCSRVQTCCESSKEKTVLQGSEVEELNERLRILEEETETMKEALFWSMEERKNMITQIYRQFELLHPCQSPRNLVIGESSF